MQNTNLYTRRKYLKYIFLSLIFLIIPILFFAGCGETEEQTKTSYEIVKVNYHYEYDVLIEHYYEETYRLVAGSTNEITNFYKATKPGYVLLGYTLEEEGQGELITSLTIQGNSNGIQEYDLYAKWKKAEYTIEYHLDGGINNPNNKTEVEGKFTLKSPTREGYNFVEWYSDESLKYPILEVGPTEDNVTVHVYAKWEKLHTISYVSNIDNLPVTGDIYTEFLSNYDISITLSIQYFKGYLFTGWTCDTPNIREKFEIEEMYNDGTKFFSPADCTEDVVFVANFIKQNETGCIYEYTYESVQIDEYSSVIYPKVIVNVEEGVEEVVIGDVTQDNVISSIIKYVTIIHSGENPPKLIYNKDNIPEENITFEKKA